MVNRAEQLRSPINTSVDRLLTGNDTLYGRPPSVVAKLIQTKLNTLSQSGRAVTGVVALPDYHNFGSDGGIKDIFFLTRAPLSRDVIPTHWETTTVAQSDRRTYENVHTDKIQGNLAARIAELEAEGKIVAHVVAITDHHESAFAQGVGGFDGLKDFVICYF